MLLAVTFSRAAESAKPATERVGDYDSRIVSFAHFWSEPAREERDAIVGSAKAAKGAGEAAKFKELNGQLVAAQKPE